MQHRANIRPAGIWIEGQEYVPASWADMLQEKLREKQRSTASHNHHFAAIADMWANLPQSHAGAPYAASAKAFRKHGLIQRGFCDVDTIDCETHEIACRVAPVVAKNARAAHGYALTIVRGSLVICSTPHSQSYKAMGKERFHESKEAILDWAGQLLGIAA